MNHIKIFLFDSPNLGWSVWACRLTSPIDSQWPYKSGEFISFNHKWSTINVLVPDTKNVDFTIKRIYSIFSARFLCFGSSHIIEALTLFDFFFFCLIYWWYFWISILSQLEPQFLAVRFNAVPLIINCISTIYKSYCRIELILPKYVSQLPFQLRLNIYLEQLLFRNHECV